MCVTYMFGTQIALCQFRTLVTGGMCDTQEALKSSQPYIIDGTVHFQLLS